jgi:hypothetical protein
MADIEPTIPPTVDPYYNAVWFVHPDPGHNVPRPEGPAGCYCSEEGVQIGGWVVAMVNGSMCIFPASTAPESINFGAYALEILENMPPNPAVQPVRFNLATLRYEPTS